MQILCPSINGAAQTGCTLSQHQRSSVRHVFQPALGRRRPTAMVVMAGRQMSSPRAARVKPERWEPDVILNDDIPADQVRLINTDKEMIGIVTREEALRMADELQVDVICISPDADPPVCRLLEYSKYRYELEKASKEAKKKQKAGHVDIKELKMRPNTDVHDYQVRLRAAEKFIAKGNKVKLSLQFRGREMEFRDIGKELMEKFVNDLGEAAQVESGPKMIGRTMAMVIVPRKTS